jgi:hypothetical protein
MLGITPSKKRGIRGVWPAAFSVLLIFAFINPIVESAEYSEPIPFMFAHYALFIAGFVLGAVYFRANRWLFVPGVIIAFFWHLPLPFALSASEFKFRAVEEFSLLTSGLLVGASLVSTGWKVKGILLGLWALADNALSVIFIVSPQTYSHEGLLQSPYQNLQFPLLGVTMILLMNSLVAVVVFFYTSRLAKELKGQNQKSI